MEKKSKVCEPEKKISTWQRFPWEIGSITQNSSSTAHGDIGIILYCGIENPSPISPLFSLYYYYLLSPVQNIRSPSSGAVLSLWEVRCEKNTFVCSVSQDNSPAARREDREEGVHHGYFTWHQAADGHFVTQQQPQHHCQVVPQSVCHSIMTTTSSA